MLSLDACVIGEDRRRGCEAADAIDWRQVVAFSSAHMVLPALADRLEDASVAPPFDVRCFFREMEMANAARNARHQSVLFEIGAALSPLGEPPVVLKVGAFLVDGGDGPSAPWRLM